MELVRIVLVAGSQPKFLKPLGLDCFVRVHRPQTELGKTNHQRPHRDKREHRGNNVRWFHVAGPRCR